jgi:hypothetical protein
MALKSLSINEIGDAKAKVLAGGKVTNFVPNLNMSWHDDEFYINLNRKDKNVTTDRASTDSKGKTVLDGDDKDLFYIDEKGRFKWDIEFAEKPSKNVFEWELKCSKDIEFHYQDTLENDWKNSSQKLTLEEYVNGRERSDEIVGSYAVYCTKKHNKYKTGKLCHIHRPLCIDAKGDKFYVDLLIEKGKLSITIPQDKLDSCSYPLTLDPTLGYTTIGESTTLKLSGYSACTNLDITMSENGTATKIYAAKVGDGIATDVGFGVYNDNGSGKPGTLLDSGIVSITSVEASWYSLDIEGSLTSGSKYFPAASLRAANRYDTYNNGVSGYYWEDGALNDNPISQDDTGNLSLYIEYTASGGATFTPKIIMVM